MSRRFRTSECDQRPTWVRRLHDVLADAKGGGRYRRGIAFDDRGRLCSGCGRSTVDHKRLLGQLGSGHSTFDMRGAGRLARQASSRSTSWALTRPGGLIGARAYSIDMSPATSDAAVCSNNLRVPRVVRSI